MFKQLLCMAIILLIFYSKIRMKYKKWCSSSKLFLWNQWANLSSVSSLSLIDSSQKEPSENISWSHIPQDEENILKYCQESVYETYKDKMFHKITNSSYYEMSNLIQKLLKVCKIFQVSSDSYQAACLYSDIICCLIDKHFYDSFLFFNTWKALCENVNPLEIAVSDNRTQHRRQYKSAVILEYILTVAQLARVSFRGSFIQVRGQNQMELTFCPVTLALLDGDIEQMSVLLKFGFTQSSKRVSTYDKYFLFPSNATYLWLQTSLQEINSRSSIITEILLFLIHMISFRSRTKRANLLKCFLLLWKSSTTPLVTPSEMEEDLLSRFRVPPTLDRSGFFPCTLKQFHRLVYFYEGVYNCLEEAPEVAQPRSLQHLCKYAIRRALSLTWNLPHGIYFLPIPEAIKLYIDS